VPSPFTSVVGVGGAGVLPFNGADLAVPGLALPPPYGSALVEALSPSQLGGLPGEESPSASFFERPWA
jgi:hypothetical protein